MYSYRSHEIQCPYCYDEISLEIINGIEFSNLINDEDQMIVECDTCGFSYMIELSVETVYMTSEVEQPEKWNEKIIIDYPGQMFFEFN